MAELKRAIDKHKSETTSWLEAGVWVVLVLAPVVIALAWGPYFDDTVYVTFRHARSLAVGQGAAGDLAAGRAILSGSPLYLLTLSLLARLGVPLPQASPVIGALGWGVTAVAAYGAGRNMRRPVTAAIAAALITFSPMVVSTLGTDIPWVVALAWVAIASAMRARWLAQTAALVLLLGTRFELSTLALTTSLLAVEWIERKRFPVWSSLAVAATVLGLGLATVRQVVPLFPLPRLGLAQWRGELQQFLEESEFYWLFLPLIGLGLLAEKRKALWAGLLWGTVSVLGGGTAAGIPLATLGLFLAGLGVDWLVEWVEARSLVRLDRPALALGLALVAGLPLGIAQASSLLQRYQFRPVVLQELEGQAAGWLRAHAEPAAVVLSSERVGYLTDRSVLPWDGTGGGREDLAALLEILSQDPPEYCVSFRSLAWDRLTRTEWFQDAYEPLQQFESPYDSTSPFTVWGYRLRAFDEGEHRPLPMNVHLPEGADLVGYHYWPDRILPGDTISVTLFLRATQPVTVPFRIAVRLIPLSDAVDSPQSETAASCSVPARGRATGQIVAERCVLTTTADIAFGAYRLELSAVAPESERVLAIRQRESTASLDRIALGDVIVPWQGQADAAQPVRANLGDQVSLLGFEAPDDLSPATTCDVVLYWEALRPLEDDYIVFVHLLGPGGQLAASHDGPPVGGRYPTTAWRPGDVVRDVISLVLDPDAPAGMYRLQVGMYRWPTMERLPVWDDQGVEQADRVIVLQSVEVR